MIKVDGRYYDSIDDAPDLGTLTCSKAEGDKREYIGYVGDEDKLPIYDDLASDSSATIYNTSGGIEKIFTYDSNKKAWIKN